MKKRRSKNVWGMRRTLCKMQVSLVGEGSWHILSNPNDVIAKQRLVRWEKQKKSMGSKERGKEEQKLLGWEGTNVSPPDMKINTSNTHSCPVPLWIHRRINRTQFAPKFYCTTVVGEGTYMDEYLYIYVHLYLNSVNNFTGTVATVFCHVFFGLHGTSASF